MEQMEQLEQVGARVGNIGTTLDFLEEVEDCKDRKQSLKWFFTYNNYNKEIDLEQMEQLLENISKSYIFQEELGKNGTPHLQGCFWLKPKTRRRLTELKKIFSHISNGIYFAIVRSWEHSINYCNKIDTKNGKTFKKNVKLKTPIKILDYKNLYDWELEILSVISKEADDRKIYWYYETTGNVGKSTFCKYLCVKHQAIILGGKGNDMKYAVQSYQEKKGYYPPLIIIDIARASFNRISYTGIEDIKNACFFSPKYESGMVIGNSPHIIIFANDTPEFDKMSKDRWIVKEIVKSSGLTKSFKYDDDECYILSDDEEIEDTNIQQNTFGGI